MEYNTENNVDNQYIKRTPNNKNYNRKKKRKKKNNVILKFIPLIILLLIVVLIIPKNKEPKIQKDNKGKTIEVSESLDKNKDEIMNITSKKELGWELTLANKEHKISEDYKIELKSIDKYREIDARVYDDYDRMMFNMKKDGIENIWPQSTYRSVKTQEEIFNDKVKYYQEQGMTREKAEIETEKTIMRPGCSDHNLGLAIDFNYVNEKFEELKGFKWLQKNAENYGFVLRYPKEKEDITKVKYEPWHWRYVGIENAKEMNKRNMCLEEYVEYLNNL